MTVLDIILAALILFGMVRGFMKGLFVEVAALVALAAGVFGAIHFSDFVGGFLETKMSWNAQTIKVSAFAITFVIIILAITLAGKALTKLANFAALGILNKLLGGAFGGLKIGLILSVVLIIFGKLNSTIPFFSDEELGKSALYKPVKSLAPMIFPSIIKSDDAADKEEA